MKLKKRTKRILIILFLGIVFLTYSSLETRWIKITNVTIESPDIPTAFDGKRIVFVSDIHHGEALSRERVKKLALRINELHPDIIILGGDYISFEEKYIGQVFAELKNLKSNYGIYGVLGNHDCFVNDTLTQKMMVGDGIKDCDNKSYWLRINSDSIKIGGVIDPDGGKPESDSTVFDVHRKDFCILITHRPEFIKHLNTDLVDLTLSGHTHGGQITFFGLWAPILPTENGLWAAVSLSAETQKYRYGLIQPRPNMQSYITSGIGTRFPDIRFFCRPEIAVLKLKKIRHK